MTKTRAAAATTPFTVNRADIDRRRAILQEIVDNTETPEAAAAWEERIAQECVNNLPSLRQFLRWNIGSGADFSMVTAALREISEFLSARFDNMSERYPGRDRIAALAMYKLCNISS